MDLEDTNSGSAGGTSPLRHDHLLRWLALACLVGLAFGWVLLWIQGSYFGRDVFWILSYKGADQPVVDPPYRVGVHTFGDYLEPWRWVQLTNPWLDLRPTPNYTPASMLLFEPFGALPARSGLWPYLALLLVALLVPSLWATWRSPWTVRCAAIAAAVLTVPVTMTLDRGNQVALLVPFLLLFTVSVARGKDRTAVLGLVGAVALKAYPAFIAIGLIWRRPVRNGAIAAAVALVLSLAIWSVYPGETVTTARAWLDSILGFSRDERADPLLPGFNYSLTGGLLLVLNGTGAGAWISAHPWVPGIAYLLGTAIVVLRQHHPTLIGFSLVLATTQLVVPVSARYTTVYALVLVAVLVRDALDVDARPHLSLPSGALPRLRALLWISVMVVTLVPIPLTFSGGVALTPYILALGWVALLIAELLCGHDRSRAPRMSAPAPEG